VDVKPQDLEQALSEMLSQEINEELAIEMRCADLVSQGWTMVTIDAAMEDIGDWMQANIRGDWSAFHHRCLFEQADEAVLFTLRWSA
jgi:outer membrane protease